MSADTHSELSVRAEKAQKEPQLSGPLDICPGDYTRQQLLARANQMLDNGKCRVCCRYPLQHPSESSVAAANSKSGSNLPRAPAVKTVSADGKIYKADDTAETKELNSRSASSAQNLELRLVSRTENSMELAWTGGGMDKAGASEELKSVYLLHMRIDEAGEREKGFHLSFQGQGHNYNVPSLLPNTHYNFKVSCCTNASGDPTQKGQWRFSPVHTFQTPAGKRSGGKREPHPEVLSNIEIAKLRKSQQNKKKKSKKQQKKKTEQDVQKEAEEKEQEVAAAKAAAAREEAERKRQAREAEERRRKQQQEEDRKKRKAEQAAKKAAEAEARRLEQERIEKEKESQRIAELVAYENYLKQRERELELERKNAEMKALEEFNRKKAEEEKQRKEKEEREARERALQEENNRKRMQELQMIQQQAAQVRLNPLAPAVSVSPGSQAVEDSPKLSKRQQKQLKQRQKQNKGPSPGVPAARKQPFVSAAVSGSAPVGPAAGLPVHHQESPSVSDNVPMSVGWSSSALAGGMTLSNATSSHVDVAGGVNPSLLAYPSLGGDALSHSTLTNVGGLSGGGLHAGLPQSMGHSSTTSSNAGLHVGTSSMYGMTLDEHLSQAELQRRHAELEEQLKMLERQEQMMQRGLLQHPQDLSSWAGSMVSGNHGSASSMSLGADPAASLVPRFLTESPERTGSASRTSEPWHIASNGTLPSLSLSGSHAGGVSLEAQKLQQLAYLQKQQREHQEMLQRQRLQQQQQQLHQPQHGRHLSNSLENSSSGAVESLLGSGGLGLPLAAQASVAGFIDPVSSGVSRGHERAASHFSVEDEELLGPYSLPRGLLDGVITQQGRTGVSGLSGLLNSETDPEHDPIFGSGSGGGGASSIGNSGAGSLNLGMGLSLTGLGSEDATLGHDPWSLVSPTSLTSQSPGPSIGAPPGLRPVSASPSRSASSGSALPSAFAGLSFTPGSGTNPAAQPFRPP